VPGIVLALARPSVQWTLVDSVARKAAALESFVATLGLGGVTVSAHRAETVGRMAEHRERHDLVTARACAALPVVVEYAFPLLRPGGTLIAWKGAVTGDTPEVLAGGAAVDALGGGSVRLVDPGMPALGDHRFVVVRKGGPTPDAYPRRTGVAQRRPLGRT
jgi:16S rRNA (guanine527-N7)-methyltransferase